MGGWATAHPPLTTFRLQLLEVFGLTVFVHHQHLFFYRFYNGNEDADELKVEIKIKYDIV